MNILTIENNTFDLTQLPNEIDDMRFSVLDNSDVKNPDYFYMPLIFLESFTCPALVLRIGEYHIKMPMEWYVLIGEDDFGDLEAVPLNALNDREFKAFCYNPRTSFYPKFLPIEIVDIYPDMEWYSPKMKLGQYLSTPLSNNEEPLCAFFTKEVTKKSQVVDYNHAW